MYGYLTGLARYHLYISFIYRKNIKGPNIDPSETPQFMVPAAENMLSNETKKALFVWQE